MIDTLLTEPTNEELIEKYGEEHLVWEQGCYTVGYDGTNGYYVFVPVDDEMSVNFEGEIYWFETREEMFAEFPEENLEWCPLDSWYVFRLWW